MKKLVEYYEKLGFKKFTSDPEKLSIGYKEYEVGMYATVADILY
jgi:hypothetical protein